MHTSCCINKTFDHMVGKKKNLAESTDNTRDKVLSGVQNAKQLTSKTTIAF